VSLAHRIGPVLLVTQGDTAMRDAFKTAGSSPPANYSVKSVTLPLGARARGHHGRSWTALPLSPPGLGSSSPTTPESIS